MFSTGTLWHPFCKNDINHDSVLTCIQLQDLNPGPVVVPEAALALFAITYIGIVSSFICLIALAITYACSE